MKRFLLIFFLRHLRLLTDQVIITAWALRLLPQVSADSDVESKVFLKSLQKAPSGAAGEAPKPDGAETHPEHKVEGKEEVLQADGSTRFLRLLVGPHAAKDSKH